MADISEKYKLWYKIWVNKEAKKIIDNAKRAGTPPPTLADAEKMVTSDPNHQKKWMASEIYKKQLVKAGRIPEAYTTTDRFTTSMVKQRSAEIMKEKPTMSEEEATKRAQSDVEKRQIREEKQVAGSKDPIAAKILINISSILMDISENVVAIKDSVVMKGLDAAEKEREKAAPEKGKSKTEKAIEPVLGFFEKLFKILSLILIPMFLGFVSKFLDLSKPLTAFIAGLIAVIGSMAVNTLASKTLSAIRGRITGTPARVPPGATPPPPPPPPPPSPKTPAPAATAKTGNAITKAFSAFDNIFKVVGKILKFIPVLGQVLAVIMALFDGITGAIEGFKEDGIMGAIKGGLSGVISGLIGWIGDLSGWLVGSLLELLGFEEIGASIKDFDFTKFVKDAVGVLFDHIVNVIMLPVDFIQGYWKMVQNTFAAFKKAVTVVMEGGSIIDALSGFGEDMLKSIVGFLTELAFSLIPKALHSTGVLDPLNKVRSSVGLPTLGGGGSNIIPDPGRGRRIAALQGNVEFARGQEGVVAVEAMMAKEENQGGTFSDSVLQNFNDALEDNDIDEMHEVLTEAGITDAAQRDEYITYRSVQKQLESDIKAENAANNIQPSQTQPAQTQQLNQANQEVRAMQTPSGVPTQSTAVQQNNINNSSVNYSGNRMGSAVQGDALAAAR